MYTRTKSVSQLFIFTAVKAGLDESDAQNVSTPLSLTFTSLHKYRTRTIIEHSFLASATRASFSFFQTDYYFSIESLETRCPFIADTQTELKNEKERMRRTAHALSSPHARTHARTFSSAITHATHARTRVLSHLTSAPHECMYVCVLSPLANI